MQDRVRPVFRGGVPVEIRVRMARVDVSPEALYGLAVLQSPPAAGLENPLGGAGRKLRDEGGVSLDLGVPAGPWLKFASDARVDVGCDALQ